LLLAGSLAATALLGTPAASARVVNTWYAARSPIAQTNWLIGADNCAHGSVDCNRCAPDVEQQWSDMAAGALSWRERSWHFGWDRAAQPSGLTPDQAWDTGGIIEQHAQGFVRTNHATVKYAMSHSDDTFGSLTFVNSSDNIHALHRTASVHPSGIFALGNYVGMVDGEHSVRFVDTTRSLESHDLSFRLGPEAGGPGVRSGNGGIAMARLWGGGYLLVVGQGGVNTDPQDTDLYFVDGPLTAPHRKQRLGVYRPAPGPGFNQSENISVITECGSRSIYTVHMMGDDIGGEGYYVLARVTWGANGPWLSRVNVKRVNSDIDYCHHRSAASASVRDNGTVDLYCHERAEDNGFLSGPGDDWEFREGLNYFNW